MSSFEEVCYTRWWHCCLSKRFRSSVSRWLSIFERTPWL